MIPHNSESHAIPQCLSAFDFSQNVHLRFLLSLLSGFFLILADEQTQEIHKISSPSVGQSYACSFYAVPVYVFP